MTPSLGDWSSRSGEDLQSWCKKLGLRPDQIQVVWPHRWHEWVDMPVGSELGAWKMPVETLGAFIKAKVQLKTLPDQASGGAFQRMVEDQQRWSHAKFYEFNTGLLVGSHNWSKAAWGGVDSFEQPLNFELSVFLDREKLPIKKKLIALNEDDVPVFDRSVNERNNSWLRWVCATWNGKTLKVELRVAKGITPTVQWFDSHQWRDLTIAGPRKSIWRGRIPTEKRVPELVRIAASSAPYVDVQVLDIRVSTDPFTDVPEMIQMMADRILLQAYGGPLAEANPEPSTKAKRKKKKEDDWNDGTAADYRPAWLISSRRWTKVVDAWRKKWSGSTEPARLIDASRLATALRRIAAAQTPPEIGALIAAQELELLSKEENA